MMCFDLVDDVTTCSLIHKQKITEFSTQHTKRYEHRVLRDDHPHTVTEVGTKLLRDEGDNILCKFDHNKLNNF